MQPEATPGLANGSSARRVHPLNATPESPVGQFLSGHSGIDQAFNRIRTAMGLPGYSPVDLAPVTTALSSLTSRIDDAERRHSEALGGIGEALQAISGKLTDVDSRPSKYEAQQKNLASRLESLHERIEEIEGRNPGGELLTKLEKAIVRLSEHIEKRQHQTEKSITAIESSVTHIGSQMEELQKSSDISIEELRERIFELSENLDSVGTVAKEAVKPGALTSLERRIEEHLGEQIEVAYEKTLSDFSDRLEAAEARSADAIQAVEDEIGQTGEHITSLDEAIADIQLALEDHSGKFAVAREAQESIRNLTSRFDQSEQDYENRFDSIRSEIKALAERLEQAEAVVLEPPPPPDRDPDFAPIQSEPDTDEETSVFRKNTEFSDTGPSERSEAGEQPSPPPADLSPRDEDAAVVAAMPSGPSTSARTHTQAPQHQQKAPVLTIDDFAEEAHTAHRSVSDLLDPHEIFAAEDRMRPQSGFMEWADQNRILLLGLTIAVIASMCIVAFIVLRNTQTAAPVSNTALTEPAAPAEETTVTETATATLPQSAAVSSAEPSAPSGEERAVSLVEPVPADTPPARPDPATKAEASSPEPAPATTESPPAARTATYGPPVPTAPAPSPRDLAKTAYFDGMEILRNQPDNADLKEAAALITRASDGGLAVADYRLATLYQEGRGVEKDLTKARRLYERSAAAGNRRAMHNLGVLHAGGMFGEPDYREAGTWFTKAAQLGITDSQFNLAVLYMRGDGMSRNLSEAFRWFAIAAARGDEEAARQRDELATRLDTSKVSDLQKEAALWKPSPMAPEPNGLFREASGSDLMRRTQEILTRLGFNPGPADGQAGPRTERAIRAFQAARSLPETGRASPELLAALEQAVATKAGPDI